MPKNDPDTPLWSILTKSRSGAVSFINNLTLKEVAEIYSSLDVNYGITRYVKKVHESYTHLPHQEVGSYGGSRMCLDEDIVFRAVYGPAGWEGFADGEVVFWPKYVVIYTDNNKKVLPNEFQTSPDATRMAGVI